MTKAQNSKRLAFVLILELSVS